MDADQPLNGKSVVVADNSSGIVKRTLYEFEFDRKLVCVCLILYELAKWMSRIFVINVAYARAFGR
jgi:hypothetical protein